MSDLLEKYQLASSQYTVINPVNGLVIKDLLYGNLTVLDSKASALMTFDGILIAVASFTVQEGGVFETQTFIPLIVIIAALIAAGLCLFVAQISYPFFGKVKIIAGSPEKLDFTAELEALRGAVDWRSCFYRAAWVFSVIAVALFLIMFVLELKTSS